MTETINLGEEMEEKEVGHAKKIREMLPVKPKEIKNPLDIPGFLWKEADHGGLVVLFPGSFDEPFTRVHVLDGSGKKEFLRYTGKANAFQGQARQHWRSTKNISHFQRPTFVVAVYRRWLGLSRKFFVWRIPNPSERNGL